MKFYVARTPNQRDRLDRLFESFHAWRDPSTRERVVLWRPGRCLGLIFGLLAFFYFGGLLAVTWWLQMMVPGLEVHYGSMLLPTTWVELPGIWRNYQTSNRLAPEVNMPGGAPLRNSVKSYGEAPRHPVAVAADPAGRTLTVRAISSSPSAGVAPSGPVLTPFFLENGGVEKLLDIRSIQVSGNVTMDATHTLQFTMVKKPPNKVRLNMRDVANNREATVLSNGKAAWKWTGDPYANGVREATADEVAALMREVWYCNAAIEVIGHPMLLRELPKALGGAERYHILQTALPGDMHAQIYVNPDTWRAERIQIDYDQDGVPNSYTIMVRDWMMVEGVPEPSRIEVYVNGARLLECTFTNIAYNAGSLDSLFEPPVDAPPAPKAAAPPGGAANPPPAAGRPVLTAPEPPAGNPTAGPAPAGK